MPRNPNRHIGPWVCKCGQEFSHYSYKHANACGKPKSTKLTRREMMLVELVITEASQRLMAQELGIKPWTVQKHLDHIRNKIGCDTSIGIGMWYVRNVEMKQP